MRRMVLAAALLALLAVSCKAEINLAVELEADGSGTLIAETGFDDEFREFAFQGVDPEEAIFQDNELADLEGAEFETYREGEFTFYKISAPFTDVDDVLGAAGEDAPVDSIQVSVTEDEVRVTARTEEAAGELLGGEDVEGFSPDILADTIAIHLRLKMPGEVTSHNATRVLDDGTLEWDVPLTGEALDVQAVSDPNAGDGGGFPVGLAAAGAAVLAVGAGGAVLMARRRGKAAATTEPPLAEPVAAGVPTAAAATAALPDAPPVEAAQPPPPAAAPSQPGGDATAPPAAAVPAAEAPPVAGEAPGDADDEETPPLT